MSKDIYKGELPDYYQDKKPDDEFSAIVILVYVVGAILCLFLAKLRGGI